MVLKFWEVGEFVYLGARLTSKFNKRRRQTEASLSNAKYVGNRFEGVETLIC